MKTIRSFLILILITGLGCGRSEETHTPLASKVAVTIEVPVLFPDPPIVTPARELSGSSTMVTPTAHSESTEQTSGSIVSSLTMSPDLCMDDEGPDCATLRLGDEYLTTEAPRRNFLYSCEGPNPTAPGARESRITWINFAQNTWNFLQKLWLPAGGFTPAAGTYSQDITDKERKITFNNLPLDGKIGDWPMTQYPDLTRIDGNPGVPAARESSFVYALNPVLADKPSCLPLGTIGVTVNGVALFNAADGRGDDAVAREIVDVFGGHPAMTMYHYHFIPPRLDTEFLEDGHSGVVGYINDGFPIYGYLGENGNEMSNNDLDECHGHDHDHLGYHYHATIEYPYTVGCYKGIVSDGNRENTRPRRP